MSNGVTINIRLWSSKPDKAMEEVILNAPWAYYGSQKAYQYARNILKKRWERGEEVILKTPYYAYLYARHVIGGRWIEAEPLIAKESNSAYQYAKYVLKGRFYEAENKKVFKSSRDIYLYAKYVLKDRWKEMENTMLKSHSVNYYYSTGDLISYSKYVIKGRWKKAEPFIVKSYQIADYAKLLKGSDLEEFENMVLLESLVEPENSWMTNAAKKYIENKKL
jgi:hypothetical protein